MFYTRYYLIVVKFTNYTVYYNYFNFDPGSSFGSLDMYSKLFTLLSLAFGSSHVTPGNQWIIRRLEVSRALKSACLCASVIVMKGASLAQQRYLQLVVWNKHKWSKATQLAEPETHEQTISRNPWATSMHIIGCHWDFVLGCYAMKVIYVN